jgi:HD-GYP domain-containing protein (c-di-GMP phosphodiesterase class II)
MSSRLALLLGLTFVSREIAVQVPTRVYLIVVSLVALCAAVLVVSADRVWLPASNGNTFLLGVILIGLIIGADLFDTDLPLASVRVTISVASSLCFAAAISLGPYYGALVAGIGAIAVEVFQRRPEIKLSVNVTNYILSTFVAGWAYTSFADLSASPISGSRNISVTVGAALAFNIVNSGIIAIVLSQVVSTTPWRMWRSNIRGVAFESLSLPTLGALVPVLYEQNPIGVLLVVIPLLGPYLSFRRYGQIHRETRSTIELVADLLDRRDPYTAEHSKRVTDYVEMIIDELEFLSFEEREIILAAAPVHDLGKIGTTDLVLSKPGKLTDEEREIIKEHAAEGAAILGILSMYHDAANVVRHHHERWDGAGYPDGLAGDAIPIGARIIAVADTYDAMTSDRVYRKALSHSVALAEIRRGSGSQFDPRIVDAFLRCMHAQPVAIEVPNLRPV